MKKNNSFHLIINLLLSFILIVSIALSLSSCSSEVPPPTESKTRSETTAISVFYPNGNILIEERQVVPMSDNLPEVALKRLFAASPEKYRIVVVLPEAKVNSVRVDKKTGICTVDFSKEILDFPRADRKAKIVAFASIVETLKQFPDIKKLMITVEGKSKGEIGKKRIEDFWGELTLKKQPIEIIRKQPEGTTEGANR